MEFSDHHWKVASIYGFFHQGFLGLVPKKFENIGKSSFFVFVSLRFRIVLFFMEPKKKKSEND